MSACVRCSNEIFFHPFQDLSLRGFWLQKWMSADGAKECRKMIDHLLDLMREGKLKYQ